MHYKKTIVVLLGVGTTVAIAGWYWAGSSDVAPEAPTLALLNQPATPTDPTAPASPYPGSLVAVKTPIQHAILSTGGQPATAAPNYRTESDEHRALAAKRMNLEHASASQLQEFTTDPSPLVRNAALERLRQLEGEYEMEARVERQPGEPGQFLPTVLDVLNIEPDPFAIKSGLDYLGEYGENDPSAAQTLEQLLQRPDLPATVLMQIGELLAENYGRSPEQVRQLLLGSQSAGQLLDEDLSRLANPQPEDDAEATAPGDDQSSKPRA